MDGGIKRKVRCGILENREPWVHRVCRKDFFMKVPGKILGEIVLGKIWRSESEKLTQRVGIITEQRENILRQTLTETYG